MDFKERPEKKNPESLVSSRGFGLLWISLDYQMVEAAGVEPASANAPLSYLHA